MTATTKSFLIDHPILPDHKLRYTSLEGPENGVYVRGHSTSSVINLPNYWYALVDAGTTTVNLTPVGSHQKLYVDAINPSTVVVKSSGLSRKLNYFYTIYAERKDVPVLKTEYHKDDKDQYSV